MILSGISPVLRAQESSTKHSLWGYYHYGYIISHRSDIEALVKGYTRISEVSFVFHGNGQKDWHQKYAYPYYGLSWLYMDFGNPIQLGFGTSLIAFYDFPITRGEKLKLLFKIGIGPGYVQKVFHRTKNFQNYAVSTRMNGFAYGNLHGTYNFSDQLAASFGISISHFSNASYSKPNLGINVPAINFGIGYGFDKTEKIPRKLKSEYTFEKRINHDIILTYFTKERNPIGGRKFPTYTLMYAASRHVSYKSKFSAGSDLIYNTAHKDKADGNGNLIESPLDIAQLGFNLGYALQISDFAIYFNQGIYLYSKYKDDGLLYHRFGLRYYLKQKFILNFSMKTHYAVADNAEFGLGYRF